jgi:hypothetical protein
MPPGVQPNDLLIAEIAVRGGTATTITAPPGWTLVRRDNRASTIAQAVYRHLVPVSPPEPSSYTWNFTAGNDAAGAIAAYSGVSTASPVDASNGQGNASSTNITAPSVTVPSGHASDRLLALFSIANGSSVSTPSGMNQLWSFRAIGFGIGVAAADVNLSASGATGNRVATAATAGVNAGALIALIPQ